MDAAGLFDLAFFAERIQTYARKRLKDTTNVQTSAANFIDGAQDTAWLTKLSSAVIALARDPILLATIYEYFPNLAVFFFNALTATADYSNNGKGGGSEDRLNDPQEVLNDLMSSFGQIGGVNIFEGAWDLINTGKRIEKALKEFPTRQNISPAAPDIFHFRLGASNFYIPPINIDVQTQFKVTSFGEGAIRQKNTPKFNAGYKHTTISLQLFFPNYEEIWGISIDEASKIKLKDNFTIDFSASGDSEAKIDKFLSSLRGLVASFKYAPFLPVRNQYLNSVHGITGVCLHDMTISTIPNYPFALVVNLTLYNFNHKPFLPMIKDFNQAIHWGKFRQYMGKAAGALHNYINEEFLLVSNPDQSDKSASAIMENAGAGADQQDGMSDQEGLLGYKNEVYTTNVIREWTNGSNITFYVPQETQTKIFTPDLYGFDKSNVKAIDELARSSWKGLLASFGIEFTDNKDSYGRSLDEVVSTSVGNMVEYTVRQKVVDSIDILTAGLNQSEFQRKAYAFLIESFIRQNPVLDSGRKNWLRNFSDDSSGYNESAQIYRFNGVPFAAQERLRNIKIFFRAKALNTNSYLDFLVDQDLKKKIRNVGSGWDEKEIEEQRKIIKKDYGDAYSALVYKRFFEMGPIRELLEAARERAGSFHLREWEVPMIRIDIDPSSAIITDVSVSMKNNVVPLQIQMADEPTYQHVGGGDSSIDISMKVFGESELIKLRKIFDHINGLARLEHAAGVLGFMGIKNVITALAGIKYVLPLSFNVSTIPNFPHVYDVSIRLVDFDIFQQKREKLSSDQQKQLIEEFGTKKNPFLRIKQLWGAFNAYPDFPLELRNKGGEVVGSLDPDFYFRSFKMIDNDMTNSISLNKGKLSKLNIDEIDLYGETAVGSPYGGITYKNEIIIQRFKDLIKLNDLSGLKKYAKQTLNLNSSKTASFIIEAMRDERNERFLLDYLDSLDEGEYPTDSVANTPMKVVTGELKIGDIRARDPEAAAKLQQALSGNSDKFEEDKFISFDPDSLDVHVIIHAFPAVENPNDSKIPAIMQSADGFQFGYIDKTNGRFYLTIDDVSVKKDGSVDYVGITDIQTPDRGTTKTLTGVPGATALSDYQYAFASNDISKPQTMQGKNSSNSMTEHWEKMMIDNSYRDMSGRMIRAFPTYMLWLISERTFAGTKLFDNFYGLQSIIDFSIVSSEDLLGDTLVFRVSNMYSKLSTKEMTAIFSGGVLEQESAPGTEKLSLTTGLESVINRTLNTARNAIGHMESQYIVDIENIRLKPGVRVHLRCGYGSNPNALHTVFNGVITEVELGEVVTVTCQSDAIELSPIVNSVDKKGQSGKMDGGLNTGLYLSEPRDLMVRLLTMGTSRTREAFAYATRGLVFSENKFGIKHFGSIVYEPLNEIEYNKNLGLRNSIEDSVVAMATASGDGPISSAAGMTSAGLSQVFGAMNPFGNNINYSGVSIGPNFRIPTLGYMKTMWSNFSAQRDMEIFKRNIYPGNGTGIAQFLGGDLGDGWANVVSVTPEDNPNPRLQYLDRLTDASWNDLLRKYDQGNTAAQAAIDIANVDKETKTRGGAAATALSGTLFGLGALAAVSTAGLMLPAIGVVSAVFGGATLLGSLSGRGGANIFQTLGLLSTLDDDMPGFDEVSFRAQTYMKTVWDMFQLCARLLPNYIVAVRPFEDRSTVFYGKPHWLYTSGVVPVTTGFPSEEKAVSLGLKTPSYRSPDAELIDLLNKVNQSSNPTADYDAFRQLQSPLISLEKIAKDQAMGSDIYAPSAVLNGRVINLSDPKRMVHFKTSGQQIDINNPNAINQVDAILPTSKGWATIGYHLPISPNPEIIALDVEELSTVHKQIPQLPLRFSFPYFTDRVSGAALIDYPFYSMAKNRDAKGLTIKADRDYKLFKEDQNYRELIAYEAQVVGSTSFTSDFNDPLGYVKSNDFDFTISLEAVMFSQGLSEKLQSAVSIFDSVNSVYDPVMKNKVRMPYPYIGSELPKINSLGPGEASWEYEFIENIQDQDRLEKASYRDWGSPNSALEEQFYIAMKWPYKIVTDENGNLDEKDKLFINFKQKYFPGRNSKEFVGTPKDYKKTKVLIYSPITRTAVVCKPAFFLWGEKKVSGGYELKPDLTPKDVEISAVVSPDAAYFLGMMHFSPIESRGSTGITNRKDFGDGLYQEAAKKLSEVGLAPFPVPRECYYTFVDDTIPLGVVTTIYNPAYEFKLNKEATEYFEKYSTDVQDHLVLGFGQFDTSSSSQKALVARLALGTITTDPRVRWQRRFSRGPNRRDIAQSKSFSALRRNVCKPGSRWWNKLIVRKRSCRNVCKGG